MLIGPVKHWWSDWGSPAHGEYVAHREHVRALLIEHGYLVYTAWDAIKGSWDERAQPINNMAIRVANLIIDLTPRGVPAAGTERERELARKLHGEHRIRSLPPGVSDETILANVRVIVGRGIPYTDSEA
jgi:hypothetical protein